MTTENITEEIIIVEKTETKEVKVETFLSKISNIFLEVIVVFFWLYVLIKLFIFDIDRYILQSINSDFLWILNYKFPILLVLIVILVLTIKPINLLFSTLYLIFYIPLIFFWKIPYFIWKQQSWLFLFTIINSILSFIINFKRLLITNTALLVSIIFIINIKSIYVLYILILVIFSILCLSYVNAFIKAFKPSAIFQLYKTIIPKIKTTDLLKLDPSLKNLSITELTEKQLEARTNSLQNVVLYNRLCLFISKK